jgi:5'(3')-deoxyribonucleotidase
MAASERKPTVLLDCDGVLCDLASSVITAAHGEWYRGQHCGGRPGGLCVRAACTYAHFDVEPSYAACTQWDFDEAWRANDAARLWLAQLMQKRGFVACLQPCPGAREFVESLRSRYDVVCVTLGNSESRYWNRERERWLQSHLGFAPRDVVFTARKELVRGAVLVDDRPENCEAFQAAGGVAIMVPHPWNSYEYPAVYQAVLRRGPVPDFDFLERAIDREVEFFLKRAT